MLRVSAFPALCFFASSIVFGQDAPALRLPATVRPVRYTANLWLTPNEEHFRGVMRIEVEAQQSTPVIWMHAKALTFGTARARVGDREEPVKIQAAANDLIAVYAPDEFPRGRAVLEIEYSGEVSRSLTDGAFQQKEGGDWYIYTKFEPITARRVFPCFDEPSFKAPWQLTLHVPSGMRSFSNTPVASEKDDEHGLKAVRFEETKPLPSYLIAFAVGPFDVVETRPVGQNRVPSRIIVPKGRAKEAAYAAEVTPDLIGLLEEYFGSPYPFAKLDQIVVPFTGAWGAMENAGLIAYGQFLLTSPNDTEVRKRGRTQTILHEMSHQWFGDLVTTAWWDDIWLNEAFASWLAGKLLDQWKPEWGVKMNAASNTRVMEADSFVSARKIRQPIEAPGDIGNAFDGITYGKGSAVIAMFENYVGAQPFRQAVQLYLKQHAWDNATAGDLLAAIDEISGRGKGAAFFTFLDQGGLPQVTVDVPCQRGDAKLRLKQQRFLPVGSMGTAKEIWQMPVCVKWNGGQQCVLVTKASEEFPIHGAKGCPSWLFADANAAGYYSVTYSNGWQKKLFQKGFASLSGAEKAAAVRNLNFLFYSGRGADSALPIAAALSKNVDPAIVRQSAAFFAGLGSLVPREQETKYVRFIRAHYQKRAEELGWRPDEKDTPEVRQLRGQLVLWIAARGDDRRLLAEASKLADGWFQNRDSLDPDSVTPVLQAAAWSGGKEFYARLLAELEKTKSQRERGYMISALPWFRDAGLSRSALDLFFSKGIDPRELQPLLFNARDDNRDVVWDFVKANFDKLNATLPGARGIPFGATLPRSAAGFCDARHAEDVAAFFEERIGKLSGGQRNLANALEKIRLCSARAETIRPAIVSFLK